MTSANGPDKGELPQPATSTLRSVLSAPRRWLRGLYDWMMAWSSRPSAVAALFGFSFAESSFFPIPPDPLLMAITLARPRRWWRAAAVCTVGSILGGILGYVIGKSFMGVMGQPIIEFYHAGEKWEKVVGIYNGEWGVLFLLVAAFTPIPFKVATIAAGLTEMSFAPFVLTSAIGRGARFFLVAGLLRLFGPRIKEILERYFDVLSLLFVVALVGGFFAVKLFF